MEEYTTVPAHYAPRIHLHPWFLLLVLQNHLSMLLGAFADPDVVDGVSVSATEVVAVVWVVAAPSAAPLAVLLADTIAAPSMRVSWDGCC